MNKLRGISVADKGKRLFTLNMWEAQKANDPREVEWRGKLQSLPDGEAYYFSEWDALIQHLERMLANAESQDKETP